MGILFYFIMALACAFGASWVLRKLDFVPDHEDPEELFSVYGGIILGAGFWPLALPVALAIGVVYLGFRKGKA